MKSPATDTRDLPHDFNVLAPDITGTLFLNRYRLAENPIAQSSWDPSHPISFRATGN